MFQKYTPTQPQAQEAFIVPGRIFNVLKELWFKASNGDSENYAAAVDTDARKVAVWAVGSEGFKVRAVGLTNSRDVQKSLRRERAPRRSFALSKALGPLGDKVFWPANGPAPVKATIENIDLDGVTHKALCFTTAVTK